MGELLLEFALHLQCVPVPGREIAGDALALLLADAELACGAVAHGEHAGALVQPVLRVGMRTDVLLAVLVPVDEDRVELGGAHGSGADLVGRIEQLCASGRQRLGFGALAGVKVPPRYVAAKPYVARLLAFLVEDGNRGLLKELALNLFDRLLHELLRLDVEVVFDQLGRRGGQKLVGVGVRHVADVGGEGEAGSAVTVTVTVTFYVRGSSMSSHLAGQPLAAAGKFGCNGHVTVI